MAELLWEGLNGWHFELVIRLLFAVTAGALVGIERECRGRPAGLRTHILVALGAAAVSLISIELPRMSGIIGDQAILRVDPGRIAAGVVTGIGFLGAGAIIKIGITARGLTTAASLWCMAVVGMAFGFGLFCLAGTATALMLFSNSSWISDHFRRNSATRLASLSME